MVDVNEGPKLTPKVPSNGVDPESAPTDHTVGNGLKGVLVEQRAYQPTQNVLDKFLVFEPAMEQAWISAGLPLAVGANMRRVLANLHFILLGVTDPQGDVITSLAIWAGHDRLAREDAKVVAAGLQATMAQMGQQTVPPDEMRARQQIIQGNAPAQNGRTP